MPFEIIRNDITRVKADAIVNTANPRPLIGAGTDTAIYQAAGEKELLAERRKIGDIPPGGSAATKAFRLQARYVIHTVGPIWRGGDKGERELLKKAYEGALQLANSLSCESIAFPLLSAGSYGFPRDEALQIALSCFNRFLLQHEMLITLVIFDEDSFVISSRLYDDIEEFISNRQAREMERRYYGWERPGTIIEEAVRRPREALRKSDDSEPQKEVRRRKGMPGKESPRPEPKKAREKRAEEEEPFQDASFLMPSMAALAAPVTASPPLNFDRSLEEVLRDRKATFSERLLQLIDERGLDDVTVYKKANVDRRVFSRLRRPQYQPKKETAIAFSLALELDLEEMQDLLSRAQYALNPSSSFDLIIMYFVSHRDYDMDKINAALFQYHQPVLGQPRP